MISTPVAEALRDELEERLDENEWFERWLTSGLIDRSLLKVIVMPKSYGLTFPGARRALEQALRERHEDARLRKATFTFDPSEFAEATKALAKPALDATDRVVVSGKPLQRFLSRTARVLAKAGFETIDWPTPSGFQACNVALKWAAVTVRTRLFGSARFNANMRVPTSDVDIEAHADAVAANWVHSMDAAHLALTIAALAARAGPRGPGVPVATVHDCYRVRPGDAAAVFEVVRPELIAAYRTDPLRAFADHARPALAYHDATTGDALAAKIPGLPEYGDLVLDEVAGSQYLLS